MSKDIKHEYNGRKLAKHCLKGGAKGRQGKGDHFIVEYRGRMEVIPLRPLGHGLQAKIVKWIVSVGLAVLAWVVIF